MRYSFPMIALAVLLGCAEAWAVGLTESDYTYLETHQIERNSVLLRNLSPKEQARLHALINDVASKNEPAMLAQKVIDVLKQFSLNQQWELQNPGQLWDAPRK